MFCVALSHCQTPFKNTYEINWFHERNVGDLIFRLKLIVLSFKGQEHLEIQGTSRLPVPKWSGATSN